MRFTFIDVLKAIAAQFIVLHHLVAYGPVANAMQATAPALVSWLYNDARMAVQAFLVIGGYLAARGLNNALAQAPKFPWQLLANRYLRLAVPFIAALVFAIAMAAFLRPWFSDEAVPNAPAWGQLLAHVLLLHGVHGYESLTAGAWYVAIDFQLFAMLTLVLWATRRKAQKHGQSILASAVPFVLLFCLLSLFIFNRNADLDNYALYFFGAYGLGVLAYWMGSWSRPAWGLLVLVLIGSLALILAFRERILLATVVAMALLAMRDVQGNNDKLGVKVADYFGRTSYSLFLIHFPVCLLANALFDCLGMQSGLAGFVFAMLAWFASNLLADIFYHWVEAPATRLRSTDVWLRLVSIAHKLGISTTKQK